MKTILLVVMLSILCPCTYADTNQPDQNRKNEMLLSAAHQGDFEKMRTLLEQGADVNYAQSDGNTPLHIISMLSLSDAEAQRKREAMTAYLADHGAMLDVLDIHGYTPVLLAIMKGNYAAARLLIEKGADVNKCRPNDISPLETLVESRDKEGISFALDHGADPNQSGPDGWTVLHTAVEKNLPEIVELLLQKKADVNAIKDTGYYTYGAGECTPLSMAFFNPSMRTLLEKHGARGMPGITIGNGVNVRQGKGFDQPVVDRLAYGEKITLWEIQQGGASGMAVLKDERRVDGSGTSVTLPRGKALTIDSEDGTMVSATVVHEDKTLHLRLPLEDITRINGFARIRTPRGQWGWTVLKYIRYPKRSDHAPDPDLNENARLNKNVTFEEDGSHETISLKKGTAIYIEQYCSDLAVLVKPVTVTVDGKKKRLTLPKGDTITIIEKKDGQSICAYYPDSDKRQPFTIAIDNSKLIFDPVLGFPLKGGGGSWWPGDVVAFRQPLEYRSAEKSDMAVINLFYETRNNLHAIREKLDKQASSGVSRNIERSCGMLFADYKYMVGELIFRKTTSIDGLCQEQTCNLRIFDSGHGFDEDSYTVYCFGDFPEICGFRPGMTGEEIKEKYGPAGKMTENGWVYINKPFKEMSAQNIYLYFKDGKLNAIMVVMDSGPLC